MKFTRLISFFLFTVISFFKIYAYENKYVLVGQNENKGFAKTVFILELRGSDLSDHFQINENGEIYLKVDKIVAIPTTFCNDEQKLHMLEQDITQCGSRVSPRKWQCPYCHLWWDFGQRCTNRECPTNQWEQEKERGEG